MRLRRIIIGGLLCSTIVVPAVHSADSAQDLYRDAVAKEQTLRAQTTPSPSEWRSVIQAYEIVVRRYPASGYSDNALWQAAGLARDFSAATGDVREKDRAAKLLRMLVSEYPSSKLVASALVEITRLAGSPPSPTVSAPLASMPVEPAPVPPSTTSAAVPTPAVVRSVTRLVLPEVVRVIVELDSEVAFYHERLDNPTRVFVDLHGTQLTPALRDAVLSYPDDVVTQVRIGRHPPNRTRIVLDVNNLSKYSLFTLYEPFRLVIDCERASSTTLLPLPSRPRQVALSEVATPILASAALPGSAVDGDADASHVIESTAIPSAGPAQRPPAANVRGGFSMARQLGLGASRIVIDPGHGGHDPGALNGGLSEAELVLDVALRLEQLLMQQPGFEVVLTRRLDGYVSLEERTAIANREGADLFLSIHANASGNTVTRGVETYFLNFAATADAASVAARENARSGRTMSSLPDIVKAITLSSKREESRDFAAIVQRALFRDLRAIGMRDLGVKQAPFVVLIGAEMPSILTEIAFLTNRQDQQLLKKSSYRQRIAVALFNGIVRYQQTLKSNPGKLAQQ